MSYPYLTNKLLIFYQYITNIAQPMLTPNFSQTWHGYALLCTYPILSLYSTLLLSPVSLLLLLPHFIQPKTNLTAPPLYYYCFEHDFIKFYFFHLNFNPNQTQPMGCAQNSTSEKSYK